MNTLYRLLIFCFFVYGCGEPSNNTAATPQDTIRNESNGSTEYGNKFKVDVDTKEITTEASCDFADGLYIASVDYLNPRTGHSATHKLKVRVKDCKVTQINFPNSGWLDEDHIPATEVTRKGDAKLTDDKGRIWKIHLLALNTIGRE